jgi:hypothetical protein
MAPGGGGGETSQHRSSRQRQRSNNNRRSTLDRSEEDGDVRRQHLALTTTTTTSSSRGVPHQQRGGEGMGGVWSGPLRQNEVEQLVQLRRQSLQQQQRENEEEEDDPNEAEEYMQRRITLERQLQELELHRNSNSGRLRRCETNTQQQGTSSSSLTNTRGNEVRGGSSSTTNVRRSSRRSSATTQSSQGRHTTTNNTNEEQLRRSLQGWQVQHEEQLRNSAQHQALHEEELRRSSSQQQNKAVVTTLMNKMHKKKKQPYDYPPTPKNNNVSGGTYCSSEMTTPPFRNVTSSSSRRTMAIDPSVEEDNYVRGAGAIYHHPTPQSSSSTSVPRPSSMGSTSRHGSSHHHPQLQRPAPLPFVTGGSTTANTTPGGEGEGGVPLSLQSLSSLNNGGTPRNNNSNNSNSKSNTMRRGGGGDSSRSSHNTTTSSNNSSSSRGAASIQSNESEERRRLEEYAGRRALQRLEKELEDHSEMSRSVRSYDYDLLDGQQYNTDTNNGTTTNNGSFEEEDVDGMMIDPGRSSNNNSKGGGGSRGSSNSKQMSPTPTTTNKRRTTTTTTRQHKIKSVMDRRKLAKVPQVKKSDMIIGEYLGRGNFCDVFEVTWVLPTDNNNNNNNNKRQQMMLQKPNIMGGRKQQQSSTPRGGGSSSSSSSTRSGGASTKSPEENDLSSSEQSLNITSHSNSNGKNNNGNRQHSRTSSRRRTTVDSNMTQSSAETLFSLSYSNDLCFDPILNATNMSANRRSVSQVWVEGTGVLSSIGGRGGGGGGGGGGSTSRGGGGGGGSAQHPGLARGTSFHSVSQQGSSLSLRCNPNALALKCLRPAVRAEPRKFIIGAEDLAHETAILACLDHPNIIQLHGRAEGCFSTAFQMRDKDGGDDDDDNYDGRGSVSNNGKKKKQISNEGYFIILDRLMDTLTDRIEQWKDECLAIVNMASTPLPYPPQSPPYFSTDHDAIESTLRECLRERLKVVYSIADAFEYLHSRNVVFRDLKPANVGFDQNDCVKVFDFGFATSIAPLLSRPYNGYGPLTETCGTRRYMAPEVALKLGYGKEVDVYSFGMLLWEVCALDKPFDTIQSVEEFHDIVVLYGKRPSLHVEPYWPTSLKALMSRCWSTDPLDRPTMVDVKSMLHNVLRDVSGDRNGGCNGAKFSGFGGHRVPQQGQDQVGNFMSKWRRRVSL